MISFEINSLGILRDPRIQKISHKFRNFKHCGISDRKKGEEATFIQRSKRWFITWETGRTDGRTDGHSKYPRGYGVCGLTCWKNKGSKARRKKVAVWKRAQFLPHKVGTKLVFFSKSGGGGFLETSQVHAAECQSLWYCGRGWAHFQFTKPCRGNCNFRRTKLSVSHGRSKIVPTVN